MLTWAAATAAMSVASVPLNFITSVIAENVSLFRVERVVRIGQRAQLVDLTLRLQTEKATVTLHSQVRVGGGL